MTSAYDYDAQRWVDGEEGRRLMMAQLAETLAVLEGPRAAEYLTFTHRRGEPTVTVAEAVANIKAQLVELSR